MVQTPAELLSAAIATRRAELATSERNAVDFPELAEVWAGNARVMTSLLRLLESADDEQVFTTPVALTIQCKRRHRLATVHATAPHPVLVKSRARSWRMFPNMFDNDGRRSTLPEPNAQSAVFHDELANLLALSRRMQSAGALVLWCRCGTSAVEFAEVHDALDACRTVLVTASATFSP